MESDEIDDTAYFATLRAEQKGRLPPFTLPKQVAMEWTIDTEAHYISPLLWRAEITIRHLPTETVYRYGLP